MCLKIFLTCHPHETKSLYLLYSGLHAALFFGGGQFLSAAGFVDSTTNNYKLFRKLITELKDSE